MPHEQLEEVEVIERLQKFPRILKTFLSRSGTVELSLDIDLVGSLYETGAMEEVTNNRLISAIVSNILPYSQQWRHLSIAAPLQYLLPIISLVNYGHAPRLETLLLDFFWEKTSPNVGADEDIALPFRTVLDISRSQKLSALTVYGNCDDSVIIQWNPEQLPQTLSSLMLWNVCLECTWANGDSPLFDAVGSSLRKLFLNWLLKIHPSHS